MSPNSMSESSSVQHKLSNNQFKKSAILEDVFRNVLANIKAKSFSPEEKKSEIFNQVLPYYWPTYFQRLSESILNLDKELTQQNFLNEPIKWLLDKQIILKILCENCDKIVKTSKTNNHECLKTCKDKTKLFLIEPFEKHADIVQILNLLIYYWAIQANFREVLNATKLCINENRVLKLYESIREICKIINQTSQIKLGENGNSSTLFSFKFEKFYIVFAKEKTSNLMRFAVFDDSSKDTKTDLMNTIEDWFASKAQIEICENKFVFLEELGFAILKLKSEEMVNFSSNYFSRIDNPLGYIITRLQIIFYGFDINSLSINQLELYLHELSWREKYGTCPYVSFTNLIKQASGIKSLSLEDLKKRTVVEEIRKKNIICPDEYYYGEYLSTLEKKKKSCQNLSVIQCRFCYLWFNLSNFTTHIIEHVEINEKVNFGLGCKHCFRHRINKSDHLDLVRGKYLKNSCRICCLSFPSSLKYLNHMKTCHRFFDTPYLCKECPYKTSFYLDIIKHIEIMHANKFAAFCKFCLKTYLKSENYCQLLYDHICSHFKVKSVNTCNKCCLVFLSKNELLFHVEKCHNQQKNEDHISYKLHRFAFSDPEDKKLSIDVIYSDIIDDNVNEESRIEKKNGINSKLKNQNGNNLGNKNEKSTQINTYSFKLSSKSFLRNEIDYKYYLIFKSKLIICSECSRPIDKYHFAALSKCNKCGHSTHCKNSLEYCCNMHFIGRNEIKDFKS